jgi:hypothetical protein
MSTDEPAGEQPEQIDIVTGGTTVGEFLRSQGTYRYDRDGTTVHGDASGEWTLDENGEVEDIVSFMSPLFLMKLRKQGLVEDGTAEAE